MIMLISGRAVALSGVKNKKQEGVNTFFSFLRLESLFKFEKQM